MKAVDAVGLRALQEVHHVAGAADSSDDHVLLYRLLSLDDPLGYGLLQGPANAEVAAAGAPLEIVFRVLVAHTATPSFRVAATRSEIRSTRSPTLKGSPVYCVIDSALTPLDRRYDENWPW